MVSKAALNPSQETQPGEIFYHKILSGHKKASEASWPLCFRNCSDNQAV